MTKEFFWPDEDWNSNKVWVRYFEEEYNFMKYDLLVIHKGKLVMVTLIGAGTDDCRFDRKVSNM